MLSVGPHSLCVTIRTALKIEPALCFGFALIGKRLVEGCIADAARKVTSRDVSLMLPGVPRSLFVAIIIIIIIVPFRSICVMLSQGNYATNLRLFGARILEFVKQHHEKVSAELEKLDE